MNNICKFCGGVNTNKNSEFCCKTCAKRYSSSFANTEEKRKQKSIKAKENNKIIHDNCVGKYMLNVKHCAVCGKELSYEKRYNKTCSRDCCYKLFSINTKNLIKNNPGLLGGYRKNSGHSKSGYYKGIWCQSTYELCWVIYSLDHSVKFKRFEGKLTDGNLTYIPDFILDDGKTIIELKGYEKNNSVDRKTKLAESLGYTVNVLRKDNLKYIFEYVERTYGTKDFKTLYDGYKPKYSYICANCGKEFFTDKKRKTSIVCCSRECSGLLNRKKIIDTNGHLVKDIKNKISNSLFMYYENKSPSSSQFRISEFQSDHSGAEPLGDAI